MDTSFIGRPHEYLPRRVFSTTGTDWQERINWDRLRKGRLERAKQALEQFDLGALVLFVGENIRYVTNVWQGNWKNNIFIRYAVLPRGGEPVLFETVGSDLECAKIDAPWLEGRIRPAITWRWAESAEEYMADRMVQSVLEVLKEHGVEKERIGIDMIDMRGLEAFRKAGLNVVNGAPAMSWARVIKLPEEMELHKIATAYVDAAMWRGKY